MSFQNDNDEGYAMKLIATFLILTSALFANESIASKREMLLACDGVHTYVSSQKPIPVSSSFFIGLGFVEHNSVRFSICSESNTVIEFANSCSSPAVYGSISLATLNIRMEVFSPTIDASTSQFKCSHSKK
jgi:hypothetical protein